MAEQDWYGKTIFTQIDLSNGIHKEVTYAWMPAAVGFAAGGLFLILGDYVRTSPRAVVQYYRLFLTVVIARLQLIGLLLASANEAEIKANKKQDKSSGVSGDDSLEMAAAKSGNWRRILLLVFAITLHNIPEGLAVGVCTFVRPMQRNSIQTLNNFACRLPSGDWGLTHARSLTRAVSTMRLI